jgi:hypothetical protein
VFQDGYHWDYLPADQRGQTAGPCDLVKFLAADYTALFLSRYLPPPAAAIPRIPPTLQPPEVELTPEQQRFAGGQLLGLSRLPTYPHCTVRHRWTDTSPACPPALPICCAPGPDAKTCLHCIPRGNDCP